MRLPVLIAADGASWEAGLVVALERANSPVTVVRRCLDVVDLLAVAASGQARAALIAAGLRRLDADAVDRLSAAGVVAVGVVRRGDGAAEQRLRALGVVHLVPEDADPAVVAGVLEQAVVQPVDGRPSRSFGGPAADSSWVGGSGQPVAPGHGASTGDGAAGDGSTGDGSTGDGPGGDGPAGDGSAGDGSAGERTGRGSVVAVWGPTGAPGRTTVAIALADELSRAAASALLVDLDVYGGVIASVLGLLDESPGIAAACRQAAAARLSPDTLAALAWQLSPTLRLLTGIPRAERWPELRPAALQEVLSAARGLAQFTVLDCGFCLETEEELSFDTVAPRRNGATLAALDAADLIIAVGAADPIGLQRLVRGLSDLRDAEVAAPVWVVLNKVRGGVVPGKPEQELAVALERFAGRAPAALLPWDPASLDTALSLGRSLAEARPSSALRASVRELAGAMVGQPATGRRRRAR